jgi:hypothetical protein
LRGGRRRRPRRRRKWKKEAAAAAEEEEEEGRKEGREGGRKAGGRVRRMIFWEMEPFPAGAAYDPWGLQEEIRLLKVAQFEHAERLSQHSERISKLEKRHDDSRIRSLWNTSSPFPAPLSTFSQRM